MRLVNQDAQVMYLYNETGKPGCPRNVHLYFKKDQRLQYKPNFIWTKPNCV